MCPVCCNIAPMTGEFTPPRPDGEIERLQSVGFERLGSSNFVAGGSLLVERSEDVQRLYSPYSRVDSERVEAIRLYSTDDSGVRVQVMQQSTPERIARGWGEKEYLDLTPDGYGGPVRDDDTTTPARLAELSQLDIAKQLEQSGFVAESTTDDTSILRFAQPDGGEVVAVVAENKLLGLFTPTDRAGRSGGIIDHSKVEIIGVAEIPGDFDDDPVSNGIRVSNGWAEFTIDPSFPQWPSQPRIIREPSLEEIHLVHTLPNKLANERREQSGFIQGDANTTETIRGLDSINGVPVRQLNVDMQPGRSSGAGFLGEGENVIDVMARDNDVVQAHGLTHNDLALPLRYIDRLYQLGMLRDTSMGSPRGVNEITIGGHPYKIDAIAWHGYQDSPFRDGTRTDHDFKVLNMATGESFSYSGLIPEMVARYGFYEGLGTGYRVAPETIINTFSHLRPTQEQGADADPVIALTSGQTANATLTTLDQVVCFRRLHEAGVAAITEADVAIQFASANDVLGFLNSESNLPLLSRLDVAALAGLEPTSLVLSGYSDTRNIQKVLGQLDEATQRAVISLITKIDTSEQDSWTRSYGLKELISASVKEVDGVHVEQPLAGLIDKLEHTPAQFLKAFYEAAGGRYSEWSSHKIGEPRGTRHTKVELDEERTRALMAVHGARVMPFVTAFSEAMGIDGNLPEAEQAIAFFKKYHTIEKAQKVAGHFLVKNNRPDLQLTDWVRINEIVDSLGGETQPEEVDEQDRQYLSSRNMSLADLLDARKLYPAGDPETVVLQLYNGALERARGNQG